MLAEIQQELFACLGEHGFVRRSRSDDALFISDAPRDAEAQTLSTIEQKLMHAGFEILPAQNRLWKINLNDQRFHALFPKISQKRKPSFPVDLSTYLAVYELACILAAHAAVWEEQPRPMLYRIVKHSDSVAEMNRCATDLLENSAFRLRGGQPLPSEAAELLFRLIRCNTKEE